MNFRLSSTATVIKIDGIVSRRIHKDLKLVIRTGTTIVDPWGPMDER